MEPHVDRAFFTGFFRTGGDVQIKAVFADFRQTAEVIFLRVTVCQHGLDRRGAVGIANADVRPWFGILRGFPAQFTDRRGCVRDPFKQRYAAVFSVKFHTPDRAASCLYDTDSHNLPP